MEAQEKIETRKDEIRYRTDDTRRMVGKFFASPVFKTWYEDMLDSDTGEVISIERNNLLFEAGKYIDEETAQSIAFHLQCGDITEVEVSNQRRIAQPAKRYTLLPFKATAQIGNKKKSFILQAQSATLAIEVVTDYIELNFTSRFVVDSVKAMPGVIILNDRFRRAVEEVEGGNEAGEETPDGEEARDDTKYYRIGADIIAKSMDGEDDTPPMSYDFIVKTRDIDTAKAVITAWLNTQLKKEAEKEGREVKTFEVSLTSASPFNLNAIIPYAFCVAYKEDEKITITTD
ncbi:hypothetical protein E4T81_01815 [Barnesiella sp. WM24]|uniref:hypothetical protein n=1 Tax=Barnesiella sp. WM24 TaxID=2558278 RepID=UPI001071F893|nr:hypothetical protein [Barnesiella sp. WM24]TFU95291.1 hypothetical protein E4T81_01815 [Barnesiella sp. WM24]